MKQKLLVKYMQYYLLISIFSVQQRQKQKQILENKRNTDYRGIAGTNTKFWRVQIHIYSRVK